MSRCARRPRQLAVPAPAVRGALPEQAQRGDVRQLLEHAARIEASDARFAPFVQELRGLAGRFQMNKLCQFLQDRCPGS
jgi:hypothetical protein